MKNKLFITLASLLLATGLNAQTNTAPSFQTGIEQIASALGSAPWTIVGGYGRSTTGNKNVGFSQVAYNFNQNVGLVFGYDVLWGGTMLHQTELVKGGITLSAPIHPFAFIGSTALTNVVGTPFVADLLAQPQGDANLGNLIVTGINFDLYKFKNFEIVAGAEYVNRSGQGAWDGNYICGHIGISRRF